MTIGDRNKTMAAVGARPDNENDNSNNTDTSDTKTGLTVTDLPSNAPTSVHGVLIQSVKPGSFADENGLRGASGMVITAVNKKPIHNRQEYNAIINSLKSGSDVVFEVVDPRDPKSGGTLLGGTLP